MNRNNLILALLAVVQAALIATVFWTSARPVSQTFAPLISADKAAISAFTISDDTGQSLTLEKINDAWVLPDADNFPADEVRIDSFLTSLMNTKPQGLIARNASSYDRLSISDNNFVRKIELVNSSGKDDVLYLGSSPRASAAHIRSSSGPNVYLTTDLRSSDASTEKSAWIDTSYLSFASNDVVEVTITNAQGDFSFSKDGDTWAMASPVTGESLDPEKVNSIIRNMANLRMLEPLNLASSNSHGTDAPIAAIEIKTRTEVIPEGTNPTDDTASSSEAETSTSPAEPTYTEANFTVAVGDALEDAYAVKGSESDYVVSVNSYLLEALINNSADDFMVQTEDTDQP
ncbi:MAG: DUF4340 domain-containing protein [Trueperaceae bacterium]|nr:DUF4340 domain-containing protein [Trueperaceae bacterium]